MDEFLKMLFTVGVVILVSYWWNRHTDLRLAVETLTNQQKRFEATLSEISAASERATEQLMVKIDRLERNLWEIREERTK
jgi:hypothetical protein